MELSRLDRIPIAKHQLFRALADATRRDILARPLTETVRVRSGCAVPDELRRAVQKRADRAKRRKVDRPWKFTASIHPGIARWVDPSVVRNEA